MRDVTNSCTNEQTYGKKIRLLKYPYAVNARDLKNSVYIPVEKPLLVNKISTLTVP